MCYTVINVTNFLKEMSNSRTCTEYEEAPSLSTLVPPAIQLIAGKVQIFFSSKYFDTMSILGVSFILYILKFQQVLVFEFS